MAQTAEDHGIDIAGCILKEQYKLIEDQEIKLTERAKVQNETFERKISELMQLQGKLDITESSKSDMEKTMMDLQHSLTQLQMEADYFNRKHNCCISSLRRWKAKMKACRVIPDNLNWPNDASILNEFKSAIQSSVLKNDQFAEIEGLALRYIRMLS